VRAIVAIGAALLVLATGLAPHAHDGRLGSHACAACVTATGDAAAAATPDVAPRPLLPTDLAVTPVDGLAPGFPLGAVSGQSPPPA
jgi:hypothetical protein